MKLKIKNPVNLVGNSFAAPFLGIKLADKLEQGQEVELIDSNDQDLTLAEVLEIWAGPLYQCPAMLLEQMQDPLCRTFSGLQTHLMLIKRGGVSPSDNVTILFLRPKVSSLIRPTSSQIEKFRRGDQ